MRRRIVEIEPRIEVCFVALTERGIAFGNQIVARGNFCFGSLLALSVGTNTAICFHCLFAEEKLIDFFSKL
jgi:hypothetical protein